MFDMVDTAFSYGRVSKEREVQNGMYFRFYAWWERSANNVTLLFLFLVVVVVVFLSSNSSQAIKTFIQYLLKQNEGLLLIAFMCQTCAQATDVTTGAAA